MQPEQSKPQIGPENAPILPQGAGERVPVLPSPEKAIELGNEQKSEQIAEASAAASDLSGLVVPAQTPTSTAVADDQVIDDSPVIAGDEDVIEKEWVDRAKKIIKDTAGDPHQRTSKVNQLQKSYLKKRYGKEIGVAD